MMMRSSSSETGRPPVAVDLAAAASASVAVVAMNNVSDEDKAAALSDIYGTSSSQAITNWYEAEQQHEGGMLEKARSQLQEALQLIPNDSGEKSAYLEALSVAPHLVELESCPDKFLRFAKFDPWAAARRIVSYWAKRKELFGDRAMLPMIQSSSSTTITGNEKEEEEGALSKDDMDVLNTGFCMVLPHDLHGRGVLFHDRGRLTDPEMLDPGKRFRCLFYLLTVLAECESCQKLGYVIISAYGAKTRAASFDRNLSSQGIDLLQSGIIPIRLNAMHLVMTSHRPVLNTIVSVTFQLLERWEFIKQRTVFHSSMSPEKLLEEFKEYGFDPECIPKPLGGSWTFGCFRRWKDDRIRKEKLQHEKKKQGDSSTTMTMDEMLQAAAQTREEEARRRKREMDAVYARRKRARLKIEMEVTEKEVERLKKQQQELRNTGERLEQLLQRASEIVAFYERNPNAVLLATTPQLDTAASVPANHVNFQARDAAAVQRPQCPLPPGNNQIRAPLLNVQGVVQRLHQQQVLHRELEQQRMQEQILASALSLPQQQNHHQAVNPSHVAAVGLPSLSHSIGAAGALHPTTVQQQLLMRTITASAGQQPSPPPPTTMGNRPSAEDQKEHVFEWLLNLMRGQMH